MTADEVIQVVEEMEDKKNLKVRLALCSALGQLSTVKSLETN